MTVQGTSDWDRKQYRPYKIAVICQLLGERGEDADQLLQDIGLRAEALHDNETLISLRQLVSCYEWASSEREPGFGLLVGQRLGMTAYGIYGYALVSSATLRSALEFSIDYHELAAPTTRMIMVDTGGSQIRLQLEDRIGSHTAYRFNMDVQLSLVFTLFKDMLGADVRFDSMQVDIEADEEIQREYQLLFDCPVQFSQPANGCVIARTMLELPLKRANPLTSNFAREICEKALRDMVGERSETQRVAELLTDNLMDFHDIQSVALRLHMSTRTLHRKLAQEGSSFHSILSGIRRELALRYLSDTRMSAVQIAERLGFSDAASFGRAFRGWTGKTLREARQTQG